MIDLKYNKQTINRRKFSKSDKEYLQKPIANITFKDELLKTLPLRLGMKQEGLLFNIILEVPADAIRKEKGIKGIIIGNQEIVWKKKKLYDMIIYKENTKEFTDKPLELGKLLDKG